MVSIEFFPHPSLYSAALYWLPHFSSFGNKALEFFCDHSPLFFSFFTFFPLSDYASHIPYPPPFSSSPLVLGLVSIFRAFFLLAFEFRHDPFCEMSPHLSLFFLSLLRRGTSSPF